MLKAETHCRQTSLCAQEGPQDGLSHSSGPGILGFTHRRLWTSIECHFNTSHVGLIVRHSSECGVHACPDRKSEGEDFNVRRSDLKTYSAVVEAAQREQQCAKLLSLRLEARCEGVPGWRVGGGSSFCSNFFLAIEALTAHVTIRPFPNKDSRGSLL